MAKNGANTHSLLRVRQRLGKYRIERRLSDGAFAAVYQAFDTIEGARVALKIPHLHLTDDQFLDDFRREVRMAARLDHANILPLKNATFIDKQFVMSYPLGERTLGDRLQHRIAMRTALDLAEQALEAVAHAHAHRIIHCDIKPENFILFRGNHLRLADFGIAKVSMRTIEASGSGTIGYIAPEQAMGRPSQQSDVFSLALILYRMFTGHLPEWPYEWPPAPGAVELRRRLHPDMLRLLRRAMHVKPTARYRNAEYMLKAFRAAKPKVLAQLKRGKRTPKKKRPVQDWRQVRMKQFQRDFGRALHTSHSCKKCKGPVSESMIACPWCGNDRKIHRGETSFPARCGRCGRGCKLDWKYCAWCYGAGFKDVSDRAYSDTRYEWQCTHRACPGGILMSFMRYCPWCRRATKRKWKIPGSSERCSSCGWGVLKSFWSHCPWCAKGLSRKK
jgi:serine/threonine-protein kinase